MCAWLHSLCVCLGAYAVVLNKLDGHQLHVIGVSVLAPLLYCYAFGLNELDGLHGVFCCIWAL